MEPMIPSMSHALSVTILLSLHEKRMTDQLLPQIVRFTDVEQHKRSRPRAGALHIKQSCSFWAQPLQRQGVPLSNACARLSGSLDRNLSPLTQHLHSS